MTVTVTAPPLPQAAYDHADLFREPVYADGQPYTDDTEDLEDDA